MVDRGPGLIDDEVRRALKMAACELHLQKKDRIRIHKDVCDGVVST